MLKVAFTLLTTTESIFLKSAWDHSGGLNLIVVYVLLPTKCQFVDITYNKYETPACQLQGFGKRTDQSRGWARNGCTSKFKKDYPAQMIIDHRLVNTVVGPNLLLEILHRSLALMIFLQIMYCHDLHRVYTTYEDKKKI